MTYLINCIYNVKKSLETDDMKNSDGELKDIFHRVFVRSHTFKKYIYNNPLSPAYVDLNVATNFLRETLNETDLNQLLVDLHTFINADLNGSEERVMKLYNIAAKLNLQNNVVGIVKDYMQISKKALELHKLEPRDELSPFQRGVAICYRLVSILDKAEMTGYHNTRKFQFLKFIPKHIFPREAIEYFERYGSINNLALELENGLTAIKNELSMIEKEMFMEDLYFVAAEDLEYSQKEITYLFKIKKGIGISDESNDRAIRANRNML